MSTGEDGRHVSAGEAEASVLSAASGRTKGGTEPPSASGGPGMLHVPELASLITVAPDSTVSRTAVRADGVRVVLFAFDAGQELTEHTAAVPVLLSVLDGRLEVAAAGSRVELAPGGLVHLAARVPHEVRALEPTRMVLTMLDPRQHA